MLMIHLFLAALSLLTFQVNGEYVVGCYYTNWSQHRSGKGRFLPSNIDPSLCTHLYYAFANIDPGTLTLTTFEANDISESPDTPSLYDEFNKLKQQNSKLKTLLAVGGETVGVDVFKKLMKSGNDRKKFILNVIETLRKFDFDGLELSWLYPDAASKTDFTKLIKELRVEFKKEAAAENRPSLLLTASVAAWKPKIEVGYEPAKLSLYLDLINILTYDFHGSWESKTGHNAPLYHRKGDAGDLLQMNQEAAAVNWIESGVPSDKLVLGLAFFGRTFKLKSNNLNSVNSPTLGAGNSGPFTQSAGSLAYYEICQEYKTATKKWDATQFVPYAYKGNQWVSFDNVKSINIKCIYAAQSKLAGVNVWSMDMDDFTGSFCGHGKYPLLTTVKDTFENFTMTNH